MTTAARTQRPATPTSLKRRASLAYLAAAIAIPAALVSASAGFADQAAVAVAVTAPHADCVASYTSAATDTPIKTINYVTGTWGHWATGAALCSPDDRWQAVYQIDGNFVVYDMSLTPGPSIWHTFTYSDTIGRSTSMLLRADGDLVLLDAQGNVLRHTGTAGIPVPATVTLTNDPILTITDANGTVRWTSAGAQDNACDDATVFACGDEPS